MGSVEAFSSQKDQEHWLWSQKTRVQILIFHGCQTRAQGQEVPEVDTERKRGNPSTGKPPQSGALR